MKEMTIQRIWRRSWNEGKQLRSRWVYWSQIIMHHCSLNRDVCEET